MLVTEEHSSDDDLPAFPKKLAPKRSCATKKPTEKPTASEFGPKHDVTYRCVGTSSQSVPRSSSKNETFYYQLLRIKAGGGGRGAGEGGDDVTHGWMSLAGRRRGDRPQNKRFPAGGWGLRVPADVSRVFFPSAFEDLFKLNSAAQE